MNTQKIKYEKLVSQALNKVSNLRTRNMLELRFGLKDGQRMTLESIGQNYGITRERVRQIEEAAFSELRNSQAVNAFDSAYRQLNDFFKQQGGVIREARLLPLLTKINQPHPSWGAVYFILNLNGQYRRYVESDKFHSLWLDSEDSFNQAAKAVDQAKKVLIQAGQPLTFDQLAGYLEGTNFKIEKTALYSYLDAAKQIGEDGFGCLGFVKWPEINPRGAKDKAYLVLKKGKQPLHFVEVTNLINQAGLGKHKAQAQTVHNELIKDSRFVLVGRGTYALGEWGYQPGTVKQVISQLLKENGPMSKGKIVREVSRHRLVKENTILINLQNKNYFIRTSEGKYTLAK